MAWKSWRGNLRPASSAAVYTQISLEPGGGGVQAAHPGWSAYHTSLNPLGTPCLSSRARRDLSEVSVDVIALATGQDDGAPLSLKKIAEVAVPPSAAFSRSTDTTELEEDEEAAIAAWFWKMVSFWGQ